MSDTRLAFFQRHCSLPCHIMVPPLRLRSLWSLMMKTVTMTVVQRLKRSALRRPSLRNLERDSLMLHTSCILAADGFSLEYQSECVRCTRCPIGWETYVPKVHSHEEVAAPTRGTHVQRLRQHATHFCASNALSSIALWVCKS
jgi:hypothetical protein